MKHLLAIMAIVGAMAPVSSHAAAGIQCDYFDYQSDAQQSLDRIHKDYPDLGSEGLDNDGDGIACNELPDRPAVIAKAQQIGGKFDPDFDFIGIYGSGYSAWYNVRLAGVKLASTRGASKEIVCPDLVTTVALAKLINPADDTFRNYYAMSSSKKPIPPGDVTDDTYDVTASVWTVADDPASPALMNEWLIRQGLAVLDDSTISGKTQTKLEAAQEAAQLDGLGIWGACVLPDAFAPVAEAPPVAGQILQQSGSGTQVVTFNVAAGATYLLTFNAGGLAFVDLYTASGDWEPGFSISTGESGVFTSAGFLAPGSYYVQITSNNPWSITIGQLS